MIQTIVVLCGLILLALYIIAVLVVALKHAVKELNDANAQLYPVILEKWDRPLIEKEDLPRYGENLPDFDETHWD